MAYEDDMDSQLGAEFIEQIKSIILACVEKSKARDGDSIEEMAVKNTEMRGKLNVIISTIEEQLALMGHNISSFFEAVSNEHDLQPYVEDAEGQQEVREQQQLCEQ